jgi:hypothetical protein
MGYITRCIEGKRIAYIPENPKIILKNFENKKKRFSKKMPELQALYLSSSGKPRVRFFE